jgi:hypothetical protein
MRFVVSHASLEKFDGWGSLSLWPGRGGTRRGSLNNGKARGSRAMGKAIASQPPLGGVGELAR